jgi:alpha-glucoside transport system substrate-binding protein
VNTRMGRPARLVVATGVAAMVLAACGGDDGGSADGGDGGDGGGSVDLLHAISGDQEQAALQQALDAFEEATGNTVNVEASPDFETVITTRVTGGNPPDVALYPQPGLLNRTVDAGSAVSFADAGIDVDGLNSSLVEGMVDTGTFDDETYGVVVKLATKSLLWYPGQAYEEAGYEVPETWDDMISTSQQIVDDGGTPWCIGIEDGAATGWVATDWVEDVMLRLHGPDVYDQWVEHEILFDSPEVREAFETIEELWFNDDFNVGGQTGILQIPFADSVSPMFEDEPGCYFHRQAGFITGSFPEDAELGTDYDFAYLPPIDDSVGSPVLFSGDLAAIHTDNPVAAELVEFLASNEGQEAWMGHEGAGSLAVTSDFDNSVYPTEALAQQGEILANADFARFDGSDLMPGEVGGGAFWEQMVAWVSGNQDLDTTLQNIDNAWPEDSA